MSKFIIRLLILFIITSITCPAFAKKSWRLLPGTEEDFVFKPSLSFITGALSSNSEVGDSDLALGAEASFMCPTLQSPDDALRQQLSVVSYENDSNKLMTVEANLHYLFDVANGFKFGIGPGIGYVRTDVSQVTTNMLAFQIGGSLHYNIEKFFVGAEYRYQLTQRDHVGSGSNNGADNWRGLVKFGFNFY